MAIEQKRGCGYRKEGGLYLMGGKPNAPCCMFPKALTICPTCSAGIKQTRGWTWIEPEVLFDVEAAPCMKAGETLGVYPLGCPVPALEGRHGLIWIGKQHYKTTLEFSHEAATQGISRRIQCVPNDFVLGETWVFFAHPEAGKGEREGVDPDGKTVMVDCLVPGVFMAFKPTSIEIIVKESELTKEKREELEKRGLTPIAVPDDDPDHCMKAA